MTAREQLLYDALLALAWLRGGEVCFCRYSLLPAEPHTDYCERARAALAAARGEPGE